jgi:hypothetical protein
MAAKDDSFYTDEDICQQVRICLYNIKRDEAFVTGELASSDYDVIKDGADDGMMNKFLNYVSKSLVKKKKVKVFKEKRLKKNYDQLLTEIAKFDPDTYVMEEDPVQTSKEPPPTKEKRGGNKMKVEVDDSKMEVDEPVDEKKSATKRRRSSTTKSTKEPKKKKSKIFKMRASEREQIAADSLNEYLSQKADILERVPEAYKKQWGSIVFGKWKKDPWRPVVILGPYQVHPDHREIWMKMFNNVSIVQHVQSRCFRRLS